MGAITDVVLDRDFWIVAAAMLALLVVLDMVDLGPADIANKINGEG